MEIFKIFNIFVTAVVTYHDTTGGHYLLNIFLYFDLRKIVGMLFCNFDILYLGTLKFVTFICKRNIKNTNFR